MKTKKKSMGFRLLLAFLLTGGVLSIMYASSDQVQEMVAVQLNRNEEIKITKPVTAVAQAPALVQKEEKSTEWEKKVIEEKPTPSVNIYSFDAPGKNVTEQGKNIPKEVTKEQWEEKSLRAKKVQKKDTEPVKNEVTKSTTKKQLVKEKKVEAIVAQKTPITFLKKDVVEVIENTTVPETVSPISRLNDSLAQEIRELEDILSQAEQNKSTILLIPQLTPTSDTTINLIKYQTEPEQFVMKNETRDGIIPEMRFEQKPTKKELKEIDDTVSMFEEKENSTEQIVIQETVLQKPSESLIAAEKEQKEDIAQRADEIAKIEAAAKLAENVRKEAELKASVQKRKKKKEQNPVITTDTVQQLPTQEVVIKTVEKKVYSFKKDYPVALKAVNGANNIACHVKPNGSGAYTRKFSEVRNFWYGRAAARNEDKWFFIDTTGTQVSKEYWSVWNYTEGFAVVAERDGATGVILYYHIDNEGKELYSERFKDLSDFKKVDENGRWTSELPKVNIVAFGRKLVSEKVGGKTVLTHVTYQIDGYGNITPCATTVDVRYK